MTANQAWQSLSNTEYTMFNDFNIKTVDNLFRGVMHNETHRDNVLKFIEKGKYLHM